METINGRLLSWASILEPGTREQAERTAAMPLIHPYLALMPDAHLGKGATVGSVIPTDRAIIPAAVGVDIGCGMVAVRTGHTAQDVARLDRRTLREAIERAVPLSAGNNNKRVSASAGPRIDALEQDALAGVGGEAEQPDGGRIRQVTSTGRVRTYSANRQLPGITLRLSEERWERLKMMSIQERRPLQDILGEAMERYMRERGLPW